MPPRETLEALATVLHKGGWTVHGCDLNIDGSDIPWRVCRNAHVHQRQAGVMLHDLADLSPGWTLSRVDDAAAKAVEALNELTAYPFAFDNWGCRDCQQETGHSPRCRVGKAIAAYQTAIATRDRRPTEADR